MVEEYKIEYISKELYKILKDHPGLCPYYIVGYPFDPKTGLIPGEMGILNGIRLIVKLQGGD